MVRCLAGTYKAAAGSDACNNCGQGKSVQQMTFDCNHDDDGGGGSGGGDYPLSYVWIIVSSVGVFSLMVVCLHCYHVIKNQSRARQNAQAIYDVHQETGQSTTYNNVVAGNAPQVQRVQEPSWSMFSFDPSAPIPGGADTWWCRHSMLPSAPIPAAPQASGSLTWYRPPPAEAHCDLIEAGARNYSVYYDSFQAGAEGHNDTVVAQTQPSAASVQSAPFQDVCVVCLSKPKTMVLVPCGHQCVCEDCATLIQDCPMCRMTIIQDIAV